VNLHPPAGAKRDPIPAPEPGMTPERLFERGVALRGLLREQQDEADERGTYPAEVHEAFLEAGFYHVTQPRLFGGYEFGLGTNYRLIVEISRGHPAAGWCLSLGGSHAYVVGSHWPEQARRELFGRDGHFIAPHRPAAMGTLKPVEGGYILNGQRNYCSGIPYATHLLCGAMLDGATPNGASGARQVAVPRAAFEMVDDWGGDRTLGMRASGSHSARVRDAFVPEHMVVQPQPHPG
jgi:3-hydroxy-9,10-secoandrosta-1,3,5(10)-triene-9,17-dione monooxygenase